MPTEEEYRQYAEEQAGHAFDALRNPDATIDDAVIGLELALMAAKMWLGEPDPVTLDPSDVAEYVEDENLPCICPPDLVARGGFRSGCPVHA